MGKDHPLYTSLFGGTPDVNRAAFVRKPKGSKTERRRQEWAPKASARQSGAQAPAESRYQSKNMSHYDEDGYRSGDDVSGPEGEEVPIAMSAPKGFQGGGRGRGESMVRPPSQYPSHQRQPSRHDSHLAPRHSGLAGVPGPDPRRSMGHSMNDGPSRPMNRDLGHSMNRGPGHSMNRGPSLSLHRERDDDHNRPRIIVIEPPRGMSNQPRSRQRAATSQRGSQRGGERR